MDDLISRQNVIQKCKAEFLNTDVQRQTEVQTLTDQSFAKGWNACNRQWMNEVLQLPSAQPEHPLLKIIQDFKEMTGCEDVLVVQKDAMKAWDENGVAYTMQPERKKGEWIPSENGMFVHCSKCGCFWESGIVKNCNMEFCPSCGNFNGSGDHVRESD